MQWEIWKDRESGEALTCPAGAEGDAARALLPNATLVLAFEARTQFEVMTAYHKEMGFEPFETDDPFYFQPLEQGVGGT